MDYKSYMELVNQYNRTKEEFKDKEDKINSKIQKLKGERSLLWEKEKTADEIMASKNREAYDKGLFRVRLGDLIEELKKSENFSEVKVSALPHISDDDYHKCVIHGLSDDMKGSKLSISFGAGCRLDDISLPIDLEMKLSDETMLGDQLEMKYIRGDFAGCFQGEYVLISKFVGNPENLILDIDPNSANMRHNEFKNAVFATIAKAEMAKTEKTVEKKND